MNELKGIPEHMTKWGVRLELPYPTEYGTYTLVDIQPADIEQHHQVEVIDENEKPLRNVWVIFGYGGPDINLTPRINHWRGSPSVLKGNAQRTNLSGYVQHTLGQGGEDIWIWDLQNGELKLSSTIVKNCNWVNDKFIHTGVKLLFQRQMLGVVTEKDRILELEKRVKALETVLGWGE